MMKLNFVQMCASVDVCMCMYVLKSRFLSTATAFHVASGTIMFIFGSVCIVVLFIKSNTAQASDTFFSSSAAGATLD